MGEKRRVPNQDKTRFLSWARKRQVQREVEESKKTAEKILSEPRDTNHKAIVDKIKKRRESEGY